MYVAHTQQTYLALLLRPCFPTESASDGTMRLLGSDLPGHGTLQVFYNGSWGIVSGYYWNWRSTQVACRQLGWTTGDSVLDYGYKYGGASGVLWKVYFDCLFPERRLLDCPRIDDFQVRLGLWAAPTLAPRR